jgi:hypothetical protein
MSPFAKTTGVREIAIEAAYDFGTWLQQDLPQDIFAVVKLGGFGVEDAKEGNKWKVTGERLRAMA